MVELDLAKVAVACSSHVIRSSWKGGRVVDCNGFENRRSESYRGFESLPFRSFLLFSSCKALQVVFSSECGLASFIKALLVELVDTLVLGTSAFCVRVQVPRRAKLDVVKTSLSSSRLRNSNVFLSFFKDFYSK